MFRKSRFNVFESKSGRHKSNLFLSDYKQENGSALSTATLANKSLPSLNNLSTGGRCRRSIAVSCLPQNGREFVDESPQKIDQSSRIRSESNHDDDSCLDDEASFMEGTVNLLIHLPGGKTVQLDVNANMQMMDVLIYVTMRHGIQPGGLCLKAAAELDRRYSNYKASTPIGKLPYREFHLVRKEDGRSDVPLKSMPKKMAALPFEPTVRISIDLPRNQKTFLRISPEATLREILLKVCQQQQICQSSSSQSNEQLILSLYTLRPSKHRDSVLDLNSALRDVGLVDFILIPTKTDVCKSRSDVISLYSNMAFEEKQKVNKSRGLFGLFRRKSKKEGAKSTSGSIMNLSQSSTLSNVDDYPLHADKLYYNEYAQSIASACQAKFISKSKSIDENAFSRQSIASSVQSIAASKPPLPPAASTKKRAAPKPPSDCQTIDNRPQASIAANGGVVLRSKPTTPLSCYAKDADGSVRPTVTQHDSGGSSGGPTDPSANHRRSSINGALSPTNSNGSVASLTSERRVTLPDVLSNSTASTSCSNKRKSRAPPPPPVRQDCLPSELVEQSLCSKVDAVSIHLSVSSEGGSNAPLPAPSPSDSTNAGEILPNSHDASGNEKVCCKDQPFYNSSDSKEEYGPNEPTSPGLSLNSISVEGQTCVEGFRCSDHDTETSNLNLSPVLPMPKTDERLRNGHRGIESSCFAKTSVESHCFNENTISIDSNLLQDNGPTAVSVPAALPSDLTANEKPSTVDEFRSSIEHSINIDLDSSLKANPSTALPPPLPSDLMVNGKLQSVEKVRCSKEEAVVADSIFARKRELNAPIPPPLTNNLNAGEKALNVTLGDINSNFDPRSKYVGKHSRSMPDAKAVVDGNACEDDLMSAIRNFGGTGGLKKTNVQSGHQFVVRRYFEPRL